jgi:tRNA (adenine57-N1/adenine58-N1)-methyltransferase
MMRMASPSVPLKPGDLVMLVDDRRKQFILRLEAGAELQTHRGIVRHDELIGGAWGSRITTHLGYSFVVLVPSLYDRLLHLRRQSQIVFPKELGYILLHLAVGEGSTVVEAGSGSGALTIALAWSVGAAGRVASYDRRADLQEVARRNIQRFGLEERVRFYERDIAEGFEERDASALFLDLPDPHLYLPQVRAALRPGSPFGAILPTSNQVSSLISALEQNDFARIEVCELLLRFYKPVAARLRPTDRMVAHTGYLVFARPVAEGARPSMGGEEAFEAGVEEPDRAGGV